MRNIKGVNQSVRRSVKLALALSALAACGAAGSLAAHAQQATDVTARNTGAKGTVVKTATGKTATTNGTATKAATANAPIVLAQTTPPAPASSSASPTPVLETVVVTGTLIARPAAETAEAITVIKATVLQNQGIVNVEQALNTVTSNTPSLNIASSVGSFSGGGTYANLRDIGASRTLVLLDGQRLAGNAFNNNLAGSAVDLSGIPFSAIDSVQVLREGASAL